MVDYPHQAGCGVVKFQIWKTDYIILKSTNLAGFQKSFFTKDQYEILKSLELSYQEFHVIKDYCEHKEIEFISTPDGIEFVKFLVKELGVKKIKLGSDEITNILNVRRIR